VSTWHILYSFFYGYCPVGSSQIRSDFGTSWPPNALIHGSDVRLHVAGVRSRPILKTSLCTTVTFIGNSSLSKKGSNSCTGVSSWGLTLFRSVSRRSEDTTNRFPCRHEATYERVHPEQPILSVHQQISRVGKSWLRG